MSVSDISRLSFSNESAASRAKKVTIRVIQDMIRRGELNVNDENGIKDKYTRLYCSYYGYYFNNSGSVIYVDRVVPMSNPPKFPCGHACVRFSRTNLFLHARKACLTIGRYKYPLKEEVTLETKEANLSQWPGPLDRAEVSRSEVEKYINMLASIGRRIKYISATHEDQRKRIIHILDRLLPGNGVIGAKSITGILLKKYQYEIEESDEGNERMLKYLLMGERQGAYEYAQSIKSWNHAACLALLNMFQPPVVCDRDANIQVIEDFINSVEDGHLKVVYHALFNRILHNRTKSTFAKVPSVGMDDFKFALLCANDCDMEFDQDREDFKLIINSKQATSSQKHAESYLISLGQRKLESYRDEEMPSHMSHLSFEERETHTSRTNIISNMDMLILNEIWEYCLNLARGTCDLENYVYITNLIPYKLVFLTKLFDFGLHDMFINYLKSIIRGLDKAKRQDFLGADSFYDWPRIELAVENISHLASFCLDTNLDNQEAFSPSPLDRQLSPSVPQIPNNFASSSQTNYNEPPQNNHMDSAQSNDFQSLQYQGEDTNSWPSWPPLQAKPSNNIPPPPTFYQSPIAEEPYNDFNPAPIPQEHQDVSPHDHQQQEQQQQQRTYQQQQQPTHQPLAQPTYQRHQQGYDYSNEPSRRTSVDRAPHMPPESSTIQPKGMTSSSPLNQHRESIQSNAPYMADSFNAFSPINEYDDIPGHLPGQMAESNTSNLPPLPQKQTIQTSTTSGATSRPVNNLQDGAQGSQTNDMNKSSNNPGGDPQKGGLLSNLYDSAKAFLPKSNSKQMILPDDTKPTIEYDNEKGVWIDKSNPQGAEYEAYNEPPPPMPPTGESGGPGPMPPINYSAPKRTKARYPKT